MLLLTNDDGFDADGIRALERAASRWRSSVITVAPVEPHSGCGHRVTVDRPLVIEQVEENHYRVNGTPADCVRMAFATLDLGQPDWVLSGINAGGNLGVDIHHSGTVAAAREAALHGWPAMALSQYHRRGQPIDWDIAASWAEAVFAAVGDFDPLKNGEFFNINFRTSNIHELTSLRLLCAATLIHRRCRCTLLKRIMAGCIGVNIRIALDCQTVMLMSVSEVRSRFRVHELFDLLVSS